MPQQRWIYVQIAWWRGGLSCGAYARGAYRWAGAGILPQRAFQAWSLEKSIINKAYSYYQLHLLLKRECAFPFSLTHIFKNIWHKIIVVFYILLNPFCVKQRIFDFMWHYIDIIINLWYNNRKEYKHLSQILFDIWLLWFDGFLWSEA